MINRSALRCMMWICVVAAVCIQITYIFIYKDYECKGDAATYINYADYCILHNSFYPTSGIVDNTAHELEPAFFIFNPGYINLLIFVRIIFGTYKAIFGFNIICMLICAWSLYRITSFLWSRTAAEFSVILWSLWPTCWQMPVNFFTEIPFVALVLISGALLTYKKFPFILASGLLLITANSIRPVGFIYIVVYLAVMIALRINLKTIAQFAGSLLAGIIIIATFYFFVSGSFFIQSNTMGVNLMQGTFPPDSVFTFHDENLSVLLEEYAETPHSVYDYDTSIRDLAISKIKENPERWLRQLPEKINYQYTNFYDLYLFKKGTENIIPRDRGLLNRIFVAFLWHIPTVMNYIIYALAITGISFLWMKKRRLLIALLIPLLMELGLTFLTVGDPRYHFPFMPVYFFLAAVGASSLKDTFKSAVSHPEAGFLM